MQIIKNALGFLKGGEEEKTPEEKKADYSHPDLGPNCYYALPNDYAPVVISSQGISCRIEYQTHGEYFVTTRSKGRIMLQEHLNARDRKKLFVTSFDFKGLIGIHLHPAGIVMTLDIEKNARGEPRPNQPPATIVSGPIPPNDAQLRAGRIMTVDLTTLSDGNPLLIASNTHQLHMMIKPTGESMESWGIYISNIHGVIRTNSPPVAMLKREGSVLIDRSFLVGLASIPDGRIIGSVWNMETIDPAMMRMTVDAAGMLTLEELFTTHGLSVVVGDGQPVQLGLLGDSPSPQEEHLRSQFAEALGKIRDRTQSNVAELGQEGKLQEIRDHLLADVARAIRKETPSGVVMLALELAVKEVVAPLYNEASGSERISTVDHQTITLLNAIVSELSGWIQTDSSAALAAAAIDAVIAEIAFELPMPGLDAMMRQELPKTQAQTLEEEQIHFEELRKNAKQFLARFLTASGVSREVQQLARQLAKNEKPEEQKELRAGLERAVKKMMRETMIQTLIRLAVKSHLIRIEQEKRKELGFVLKKDVPPVSPSDLDDIIKRYNEYARYIEPAFQERLKILLNNVLKDFQEGIVNEQIITLNPKGFVTYLVMLRNSGGKIDADSDSTAPAMTALHSIPDAIPDIHVEQPDRSVAKGFVRVVHREGQLMEADFAPKAHADKIPPGVPGNLWLIFNELAVRLMTANLTMDPNRKGERKPQDLIAQQFTRTLLLKTANLLRHQKSPPIPSSFSGIREILEGANAVVEMRLGESASEELLDLRNRPPGTTETPMDLKHELRQIIVRLQKEGAVPADAFRFKQRMRAFANAGGAQAVSQPITITAWQAQITIEALFDDKPYKKAVRLTGKEGEIVEEPVVAEKPAADEQKQVAMARERARIQAVREQTEKLSQKGISQSLNGLEFFKDFSEYEKERVAEFDVGFKLVKPQEVLIRENTKDTAFFILIKGRVAATKGGLDGQSGKVLFNLGAGEIIGELGFLTGAPRTLNIVAQEGSLVLRVDSELLNRLGCDSREKFKDQLINKLVQRLADTTSRVQKTAHDDRPDPHLQISRRESAANKGEVKQLSREETIEKIDRIPFFDQFSTFEKRRITAFNTSFHTYPSDTYVICEGDMDTSFYILIDGTVTVVKGETEIVDLGPGEFFGDMAFLTSLPRTTGVRSKSAILVLKVDQELLKRLGSEIREKIKDRFIRTLCGRLVQTTGFMQ
ncbi:MAG: cyclic nucleotide-binding domain-containing protein [Magnetococcus sp. XQGC-1]